MHCLALSSQCFVTPGAESRAGPRVVCRLDGRHDEVHLRQLSQRLRIQEREPSADGVIISKRRLHRAPERFDFRQDLGIHLAIDIDMHPALGVELQQFAGIGEPWVARRCQEAAGLLRCQMEVGIQFLLGRRAVGLLLQDGLNLLDGARLEVLSEPKPRGIKHQPDREEMVKAEDAHNSAKPWTLPRQPCGQSPCLGRSGRSRFPNRSR